MTEFSTSPAASATGADLSSERKMQLLDMIVPPFFKRLGDCTGEECGVAAVWFMDRAKALEAANAESGEAV